MSKKNNCIHQCKEHDMPISWHYLKIDDEWYLIAHEKCIIAGGIRFCSWCGKKLMNLEEIENEN